MSRAQYRRIAAANDAGRYRLMAVLTTGSTTRTLRSWRKAYEAFVAATRQEHALFVCVVDATDENSAYHRVRQQWHFQHHTEARA